ncbi:MAG: tetratricopeptide repeat protein [Desulfobacula sp.]|jgi:tetratricopeptide (TPR) repeat protein|nr:tetratricopeptide repeat protein [Desulfobacula sp.]
MKFPHSNTFIIFVFLIILQHNCFALENQMVITSDMQYEYAEKLFTGKDYGTAIVEFKRFVHFFPDSQLNDHAQFKIGVCLFNLKKFHDAARIFNEIIMGNKENEITKESFFLQSKAFMEMGNTGYAQVVLQNYLNLANDRETKDRVYFHLAQLHLKEARNGKSDSMALARDALSKISVPGADVYNTDQYIDLIKKAEQAPKKNPKLAGALAVIPGAGFFYVERYRDAFITFLLNTGLMYAAYTALDNDNKALAGVLGMVETGFYTGNIYGSISSAHKYNRAQTIKILNKEFSIIPTFNTGKNGYGLSFNYGF